MNYRLLNALTAWPIIFTACKVSLIVGTLLNIINQFDVLKGEQQWQWHMMLFNYLVPYCVSSYSSAVQYLKKG